MLYIKDGKRFNIYAQKEIDGITYANFLDESLRNRLGIVAVDEPNPPIDFDYDLYYRTEQDEAPYVVYTRKSDEQIAEVMLQKAKQVRAQEVASIIITTQAGNAFDGHEDAQNRMARALLGLGDADTMPWVLADNTIAQVTKAELQEALRLSGAAMAELWVKPYA